jgi:hypothetical protein
MNRVYSKRELFSIDMIWLETWIYTNKRWGVTQGEAYRTKEQQELHIKAGRSKVKVSQHQKRLAKDLHIWSISDPGKEISDKQWIEAGRHWCDLSPLNRWGGNFGKKKSEYFMLPLGWDRWHFERRG